VLASPDADLPRLIYADFLEEQGDDAREDRIRHGCSNPGARYSCWGDESVGLICCEASPCPLCDDLHGEGLPWSLLGERRYHVRRGFVVEVTLSWQDWIAHHAAILSACPIRRVNRPTECKYCIGRGRSTAVEGRQPCPTCRGAGKLDDWRGDGLVRLTDIPLDRTCQAFWQAADGTYTCERWAGVRFALPVPYYPNGTAAVRNAVRAAEAAGGGTVWLPSGFYDDRAEPPPVGDGITDDTAAVRAALDVRFNGVYAVGGSHAGIWVP
jgi:uncharacterized protein (TIGR02996 family)